MFRSVIGFVFSSALFLYVILCQAGVLATDGADAEDDAISEKEEVEPKLDWDVYCKYQPNQYDCATDGYGTPRYYYDIKMGDCKTARFGECHHNMNKFTTIAMCQEQCRDYRSNPLSSTIRHRGFPKYIKQWACIKVPEGGNTKQIILLFGARYENINNITGGGEVQTIFVDPGHQQIKVNLSSFIYCRLQPDFGYCTDYYPLWYFDISLRACRGFSYSGCGGNANRFPNAQACSAVCGSIIKYDKIK